MMINTKIKNILPHCLLLSLCIHTTAWMMSGTFDESLRMQPHTKLQEVKQTLVHIPKNIFSIVNTPPTPSKSDEVKVDTVSTAKETPKIKPKKIRTKKKYKRKKIARKTLTKKPKKIVVKQKSTPVVADHSNPSNAGVENHTDHHSTHTVSTSNETNDTTSHVKPKLSRAEIKGLLRGYLVSLNQLMQSIKTYPRVAARLGLEGTVLIEILVGRDGEIMSVKVAQSSGHQELDQAAKAQVQNMNKVLMPPKSLNWKPHPIRIPFKYSLQS